MEARLAESQTLLHDRAARRRGRARVQQRPRRDPGRRRASFDARRGEPPGRPVPRRDPAMADRATELTRSAPGVLPPGEVRARFDPAGARAVGDPPDDTGVPPTGVELSEEYDDTLPPVHVDISQMKQVVMGLCLNATRRWRAAAGSRCARIPTPGRRVVLEVSDTGPGSTRRRSPASSSRSSPRRASAVEWGWRRSGDRRQPRRGDPGRLPRGEGTTCTVLLPASAVPEAVAPPPPRVRRPVPAGCSWPTTRRTCAAWSTRCSKPSGTR